MYIYWLRCYVIEKTITSTIVGFSVLITRISSLVNTISAGCQHPRRKNLIYLEVGS